MLKLKPTIALSIAIFAASSAFAQDVPRPNPTPVPCIHCNTPPATAISNPVATGNGYSSSIANPIITTAANSAAQGGAGGAGGNADVSNTIGGDSNRSVVAMFPAPSTAVVPVAMNCIVTSSRAGGIGLNLIQGAHSEQHSDPVCILMQLHDRASRTGSAEQASMLFDEILQRLSQQP